MPISLQPGGFDALIFDCDGTLVDTSALHLRSFQAALGAYGLDMDRHWYMARTGLTPAALLASYAEQVQPLPADHQDLLRRVTVEFQNHIHTLQEIEIVADLVRQWSGKVPMAVASNGETANVRASLKAASLLPFFNAVVTIDDVKRGKPAPDVYLEAARQLETPPGRCLVLEDSEEGLSAAHQAGMSSIDVRPYTHG